MTDTYTPDFDDETVGHVDDIDYSSPPFRPVDSDIARPDADEDDEMHILPIEPIRPISDNQDEDFPPSSPHDPSAGGAQDVAGADEDFTEITDESSTQGRK